MAKKNKQSDDTPAAPATTTTTAPEAKPKLRLEWVRAGDLDDNPNNWRKHSPEQLAGLNQVLRDSEVGWAGALLWNERTRRLIDGHGRKKVLEPDEVVPVLIGDWSPEAEAKILLTLDPLSQMATADGDALRDLLAGATLDGALQPIDALLQDLAGPDVAEGEGEPTELMPVDVQAPPRTTWVLIGIPTVKFGAINQLVESIAAVPDTIVETTCNDAPAVAAA